MHSPFAPPSTEHLGVAWVCCRSSMQVLVAVRAQRAHRCLLACTSLFTCWRSCRTKRRTTRLHLPLSLRTTRSTCGTKWQRKIGHSLRFSTGKQLTKIRANPPNPVLPAQSLFWACQSAARMRTSVTLNRIVCLFKQHPPCFRTKRLGYRRRRTWPLPPATSRAR